MSEKSGAGCLKGLGVGCGSCAVLVLVVAVSVWAGWGSIREMGFLKNLTSTVETAKGEAVAMTALRASLNEVYPADRIDVRADLRSNNGVTVKTIAVAIVNPQFEVPESESTREELAREIAARIAVLHPTLDRYDQLRLALVREGDGGANLGSTSSFQFATAELLDAPAPGPGRDPGAAPTSP